MEIRLRLRCVLVCQFTVSFSTSELCCKCFSYNDLFVMTLGLRFLWYIYIRMKIMFQLHFVITFVIVMYFLLRHNYVIYLFDVIMFFDEVRITLYFDMFELHMERTLQLRFFARHCGIFLLRHNCVIYLFVVVTL